MMRLCNVDTIKDLCKRYNFNFSKGLGQNFLISPDVCPEIADLAITDENIGVLEIGTGFGVLTQELCERSNKVVAIEIDKKLIPVLAETMAEYDNLTIINEDVLKLDLVALIEEYFHGMEVVVCANLPYYITSPIIMKLLEDELKIKSVTVMVQKEAGERLCAEMGTRACGAITAAVRYYSEPRMLFEVTRDCFMPPPKVDSCVLQLNIQPQPDTVISKEHFFSLVKASFSQRRKTLANPVSSHFNIPKAEVIATLEELGLSKTARAEELKFEDFIALSNALNEKY